MNQVSFEDIGGVCATFLAKAGVKPGQVVKMTANGEVGPCSDGETFCGLALSNRKGFAGVQVRGFVTLPFSDSLTLGQVNLVANNAGGVKTGAEGGVSALVVSVDNAAHTAVVCL